MLEKMKVDDDNAAPEITIPSCRLTRQLLIMLSFALVPYGMYLCHIQCRERTFSLQLKMIYILFCIIVLGVLQHKLFCPA